MDINNVLKEHGIIGYRSNIKSIQRGSANVGSQIVNIDEVDLKKSIIIATSYGGVASTPADGTSNIKFFNSTSLLKTGGYIEWTVIEFNNVKSLQSGTKYILGSSDYTPLIINKINPLKSLLFFTATNNLDSTTSLVGYVGNSLVSGNILDDTTVRFNATSGAVGRTYIEWFVIEFE